MGILNVTPDSFYDAGRYFNPDKAVKRAFEMRDEGADIIDIGGESTRPGSIGVAAGEEIDRVCPVIESIRKEIGIPISVDTNKSSVAEAALKAGASMVNDISGLTFDPEMAGVIARYKAGAVLMHIRGTPENMQQDPRYDDLMMEIYTFLENSRDRALNMGIDADKIVLDPGIGFGKTMEDNYRILAGLDRLKPLNCEIMIGLSRKSLLGRLYDKDSDRLPGTIALNVISLMHGADIIRVHDVKEHRLALTAVEKFYEVNP